LAILIIELLQVQIKPEASEASKQKTKMSFYNSDGSDNENQEEDQEGQLTAVQQKMKATLLKKGTMIVDKLLDNMSPLN